MSQRKIALTLFFCLLACLAWGQNTRYDNVALGPRGPIAGATIAICTQPANTSTQPCSPLANLCSSLSDAVCVQPNPVTADSLGNYHFYVKQAQAPFTVQIYGPQVATPLILPDQVVGAGIATNNTFTGTNTFTGLLQCKNFEQIRCVDGANAAGWTGADACAWIVSAQADLPTRGGTVDARALQGTITCAGTFNVGSTTQGITLLLGHVQLIVQSGVTLFQGSRLLGSGGGSGTVGTTPTVIFASGSFPASTPLIQMQTSGIAEGTSLRDLQANCNNQTGCIGIDTGNTQDISDVVNVFVLFNRGNGVQVSGLSQNILFANVDVSASSLATTDNCMTITSSADHVNLFDFGCGSSAAGASTGAGVLCTACNFYLQGSHIENHVDGVLLTGAGNGTPVINGINALTGVTSVVHIASTWGGSAVINGVRKFGATNSIKNDIAAFNHVCTDESLSSYELGSGANSPQKFRTTCAAFSAVTFANLPTLPNGSQIYCTDCNATCAAGASTGRTCFRENGAWVH